MHIGRHLLSFFAIASIAIHSAQAWAQGGITVNQQQPEPVTGLFDQEIQHLQTTYELTDRQIRHLKVASKGALEARKRTLTSVGHEELKDWPEDVYVHAFRHQDRLYVGDNAEELWLLDHPIWTNAVRKVLGDQEQQAADRRQKNRRHLAVDMLATALDHHLRLTEEQYKALTERLRKVADQRLQHIYCQSPGVLVPPLLKIVREQSDTILEPDLRTNQRQAWDQLRPEPCTDLLAQVGLSVIDLEGGGLGGGGLGGGGGGFGGGGQGVGFF